VVVCNTSPLVAAALATDDDHHACVELFTCMHLARRALLVPATVVAKVGYLLAREAGPGWNHCSWPRSRTVTSSWSISLLRTTVEHPKFVAC